MIDEHEDMVFTIEYWVDAFKVQVFLNDGRIATSVNLYSISECVRVAKNIIIYEALMLHDEVP